MFIKILLSYFLGYLKISVEGYFVERFINICKNEKIAIWNLKRSKSISLQINVALQDFKKICKIAKKTKCKIKVESKRGVPFLLNKYKKRKVFLILLILVIFFIMLSSNFVWNVEIDVEEGQELENILEDIENAGLKVGKLKSQVDKKEIINEIRYKRDDIAWMGIELKGTNAIVRIVKSTEKPNIIDENEYCNVVSDKVGIVTKISAQTGTANVKAGDTINIGTILINGWMEGKYTGIRYVHAKGEIEAKVWHTKNKKITYNTIQRQETGNTENKYAIKFNNFKINFYKTISKFKIYDTIETENKIKIFSNFYLPISLVKVTNKEINEIKKTYNIDEAKNIGIQELEQQLEQEIQDKDKIVNKIINTYEQEDGIDVYVTYEVLESIGTNEKIVY